MRIDEFLPLLRNVRAEGEGRWQALCPAHQDRLPSLSIAMQGDRILIHCHAGCAPDRVVRALGLGLHDLFPDRPGTEVGERAWVIRDIQGNVVAKHVRRDGPDGKRMWWQRDGQNTLGGLRTCQLPLFGAERLRDLAEGATVVLTEGEKACEAVREAGLDAVATVCGASVTPDAQVLEPLARLDVVLWPDNDDAGREHMARNASKIQELGGSVRCVDWTGAPASGDAADVGDPDAVRQLVAGARQWDPSICGGVAQRPRGSLAQARAVVQRWLNLPDPEVVDVVLATVHANAHPGDPVWVLLVGPPSSAKTELLRALDRSPHVHRLASLTAKTLISGHKDAGGGLLFRIRNLSTLLLLDFGQVLSLHPNEKAPVLQRLREVYDGYTKGDFGNRADGLEWRGKLGFLAGCTPAIEKYTSVGAELGDRFILYGLEVPDPEEQAAGALSVSGREEEMREEIAESFAAALSGAGSPGEVMLPKESAEALGHLAALTARLRTPVSRNPYNHSLDYLPKPEGPARMVKALLVLGKALAALRGHSEVGPEELRTLARVALSSIPSRRRAVADALDGEKRRSKEVGLRASLPTTSAGYILEDLMCLGAVDRWSTSDADNASFAWRLKPVVADELHTVYSLLVENEAHKRKQPRDMEDSEESTGSTVVDSPVLSCELIGPSKTAPSDPNAPRTWPTCRGCRRLVPNVDENGECPDCAGTSRCEPRR